MTRPNCYEIRSCHIAILFHQKSLNPSSYRRIWKQFLALWGSK